MITFFKEFETNSASRGQLRVYKPYGEKSTPQIPKMTTRASIFKMFTFSKNSRLIFWIEIRSEILQDVLSAAKFIDFPCIFLHFAVRSRFIRTSSPFQDDFHSQCNHKAKIPQHPYDFNDFCCRGGYLIDAFLLHFWIEIRSEILQDLKEQYEGC